MNIFILTIDQISMCNVQVATCSDKPKEYSTSAVLLSSMKRVTRFQLIVLALQPATLLFQFTVTALIKPVFSDSRQLFSAEKVS